MRQMILGTVFGRAALGLRDTIEVLRAAYAQPESVGTLANDQMAGFLTTRLCEASKTFLDVGAHIGSIISEVAHHKPSVKIIAIEAIPEKVRQLRRKFPLVEFHSCAVGNSEGEVAFFINKARSGCSSLGQPSESDRSNMIEIKVPLKTLDSLITSRDVDMIKIDVEGAELGVLLGADRLVQENRPTILFESGPQTVDGLSYTKESLWEWFKDRDYAVLIPNRLAHDGSGLSQEGFLESHIYPRRTTNYFAVPNERRVEFRDRARNVLTIVAP